MEDDKGKAFDGNREEMTQKMEAFYNMGIEEGRNTAISERQAKQDKAWWEELRHVQKYRRCVLNNDNLKTACFFVIALSMITLVVLKAIEW